MVLFRPDCVNLRTLQSGRIFNSIFRHDRRTTLIKDSLQAQGLTRTTLALLFMGILVAASFWVLYPFFTALLWAAMIVVSTWPLMLKIQSRFWGRRYIAVAVMTLLLLMVLILPFSLAAVTIVSHSEEIVVWVKSLVTISLPPPPAWVGTIPVVGAKVVAQWQHLIDIGPSGISAFLTPYAGKALNWVAAMSGTAGMMIIQFILTVFIAAIFYQCGDKAATWLCLFAQRIAGHHGESSLTLAAGAIRAVALGVVGTALIQSLLGGLGLIICGVPAAAILTAFAFICCLAQVGPMLVLIPAVIWLFWTGQAGWGIALGVWTIFLGTIDNIVRPILMKQAVDLPMLLVFAGVTGGLIVFGVIGLFIGPVVLAVTYTLLDAWVVGEVPAADEYSAE
jgi:predicted PurR-regulated permease PerM